MDFRISFIHMDSSDALRDYAIQKLSEPLDRYITKPVDARLTFTKDAEQKIVNLNITAGDGFDFFVEDHGLQMYACIDALAHKLENKLRRHKERLKGHKGRASQSDITEVAIDGAATEREEPVDAGDIPLYEEAVGSGRGARRSI